MDLRSRRSIAGVTRMGVVAGLAALALGVTACGGSDPSSKSTSSNASNTASPAKKGEGLTIGALVNQGDTFFQQVQQGMQAEADAQGAELVVVASGTDATKEAKNISDLITRQVDAIAVSPLSPAGGSVAAFKTARGAGVPIVCYNGCLDDPANKDLAKGLVTSNNAELGATTGRFAAEYIKEHLDGKAVIGELNCDQFEVCKLRRTTFEKTLADAGIEAKYVANQFGQFADKSIDVATNILTAHPDINVMFAAYGDPTYGAARAIQAKGKAKDVVVFGVDMSPDLAKTMLGSPPVVQATTGQGAVEMGKRTIALAIAAAREEAIGEYEQIVKPILYSPDDKAKIEAYAGQFK